MNENNKSGAFSSYSGAGATLKNITSDMWEPITTSGNYTAYTPPKRDDRPRENPKRQQGQAVARSKSGENPRVQKEKAQKGKTQKPIRSKPENKSSQKRTAQKPTQQERQPISTMQPPQKSVKGKAKKRSKKPKVNTDRPTSRRSVNKASKQRENNNKAFVRLVRSGKTVDEAGRIMYLRKLRKRRLKNIGSVMFLSLFALIFVLVFTYYEGAKVDTIVVDGDEVYTRDEILQAAQLSEGVNMLTVRQNAINKSVTKALPFVSAIKLDYDLPDTLKLNVVSTSERLIIKNGSKYICVDKTGKVVSEKKKKLSEGTFLVDGMKQQEYTVGETFTPTPENEERFNIVLRLAEAAENNEIFTYGIIDVENLQDITLTYNSKICVYLGDGSSLASKLSQAEKVIVDSEAKDKVGYVNVKYNIGAFYMQGTMECN